MSVGTPALSAFCRFLSYNVIQSGPAPQCSHALRSINPCRLMKHSRNFGVLYHKTVVLNTSWWCELCRSGLTACRGRAGHGRGCAWGRGCEGCEGIEGWTGGGPGVDRGWQGPWEYGGKAAEAGREALQWTQRAVSGGSHGVGLSFH